MRIDRGTTLVELLVVMSILAIMMGLGATALGTLDAKRIDREAATISEWLKAIRREARVSGNVYRVVREGDRLVTEPPFSAQPLRQRNPSNMAIRVQNRVWNSLCFFPDGSACPGSIELGGPDRKRQINVDWFGSVRLRSIE